MTTLPALILALAEALSDSPYAPEVPPPGANGDPASKGLVQEVTCDDPLERAADCHVKARAVCKGDFKILKLAETDQVPAAGQPFRRGVHAHKGGVVVGAQSPLAKESHGGAKRTLTFTCKAKGDHEAEAALPKR